MLSLKLNAQPVWLTLMPEAKPPVRAQLRPMCSAFMVRARMHPEVSACEDSATHSVVLTKVVFETAVIAWEGVGDEAGVVIDPSPEAVSALLDMHEPYEAFCRDYFHPWLAVDAEKNGSAPSLNGTSAAAQTIAVPVKPSARTARAPKTRRKA